MTRLQQFIKRELKTRMLRPFYAAECTSLGDMWVYAPIGYTLRQVMKYRFPVLTIRVGQHLFYDGAVCDAYVWGNSVQLYEDANEVAGLGELLANREQKKVSALR